MVSDHGPVTSVVLPLPLKECWPWFQDPALIREWHGWEYDGLEAEIQEIFVDGVAIGEDHRTINVGTHFFNFFEDDACTRVDVHRAPLDEHSEWHEYLPDIDEGWTTFLQQLRFKLSHHRDDSRRTVFYGGTPSDPEVAPIQLVGLGEIGSREPGTEYSTTLGPGDTVTGTLWFASANQVGITVDNWGDGLLVVSNGCRGGPPYTQGQAVLTSYGLADDQHAALVARWNDWWGRHY